jgi:hypothetical protein
MSIAELDQRVQNEAFNATLDISEASDFEGAALRLEKLAALIRESAR